MGYLAALKTLAKRLIPAPLRQILRRLATFRLRGLTSAQYWTQHNVTEHRSFANAAESVDYFDWRNAQYPGYIDLMPVHEATGKVVLDYGCGPGNDLVGFAVHSQPARLIGADVSISSLTEAEARLALHGGQPAEFVRLDPERTALPFETGSIDLIHSSGVLHHLPDMEATLREFRRILRDDGHAQIMVYNYDSVWLHLYAAYIFRKMVPWKTKASKVDLFKETTDGEHCPIVKCFRPDEFCEIAARTGFDAEFRGAAASLNEMAWLPERFDAIKDIALDTESREFLSELTFDDRMVPHYRGQVAGIDACFRLTPAR
jgi:ubiquinone/menaquinone biosynthesis C-methylase UbiE